MKLPVWRAVSGFGVLGGLLAVLISLAPVVIHDYRLGGYMKTIATDTLPDDVLRSRVLQKAKELNLPVTAEEVAVTHIGGGRQIEARYVIEQNLIIYQVNLHFHPHASQ